jgi:hypothetical protein
VIYNKYLDGSQDFKPGEVLFSLTKDSSKIITNWKGLQPMLVEFPEMEGVCFSRSKKGKQREL